MAYRFGPFVYDAVSRRLLREGVEVTLTHKNRELLLFFLQNPRRLLTRAEIVEKAWGDVAVTDDAVRAQVAKLRKVLGGRRDEFLRMVRREGYRWEAEVSVEAAAPPRPLRSVSPADAPRFRLVLNDREVQLLEGPNVIGRDPDSALWIDDVSVSRRHARIVVAGGRARLEDLESTNGTYLNRRKISRPEPLSNGDEIRIGVARIVFRTVSRLGTTRSAR